MRRSPCDVLVIGAGVAGLSCAAWLAEAGLRVTILEASAVAGGRARSWTDPGTGDTVDIGPHVLLNRYSNFLALLKRLGTDSLIAWQGDKLLTVLDGARAFPVTTAKLPASPRCTGCPPFPMCCPVPPCLS